MTINELQWLIGIGLTFVLAVLGIAIGAFRAMSNRLDKAVSEVRDAVKDGDEKLHERVNRLRQDVSDNYVRRADLESHMSRSDVTQKEMRDDLKEIIKKLAALESRQQRQ